MIKSIFEMFNFKLFPFSDCLLSHKLREHIEFLSFPIIIST